MGFGSAQHRVVHLKRKNERSGSMCFLQYLSTRRRVKAERKNRPKGGRYCPKPVGFLRLARHPRSKKSARRELLSKPPGSFRFHTRKNKTRLFQAYIPGMYVLQPRTIILFVKPNATAAVDYGLATDPRTLLLLLAVAATRYRTRAVKGHPNREINRGENVVAKDSPARGRLGHT